MNTQKGVCYICGRHCKTDVHHIIEGNGNRSISEQEGLKVNLCRECHTNIHSNTSDEWIYFKDHLRKEAQAVWIVRYEEENPDKNIFQVIDEFRRLFGKSYL